MPVYSLTAGLTQKRLRRLMYQTVTYWAPRVPDYLPERVRSAVKLVDLATALLNIHFPESQDMLEVARWRLAFDEIFLLQMGVLRQKRTWQAATAQVFETAQEWLAQQIARLPFALTGAQQRVLEEIRADLASGHPMNRLLQGDVGSGKTVVAALAIAMVTRHGAPGRRHGPHQHPGRTALPQPYRACWPSPTKKAIAAAAARKRSACWSAIHPKPRKQEIRAGTGRRQHQAGDWHARLIEVPVQFQRLQLAVIDEQHRFGVAQRAALRAKGDNPHLLVMTATPIPRSLA